MGRQTCALCGSRLDPRDPTCRRCGEVVAAAGPSVQPSRGTSPSRGRVVWLAAVGLVAGLALALVAVPRLRGPGADVVPTALDASGLEAAPAVAPPVDTAVGESAERALATERAFTTEMSRGQMAFDAGRFEEALAEFRAAFARDPEDALAANHVGQTLMRLGRAEEAVTVLAQAVELAPSRWDFHFNLARAQASLARWDEAVAGYRRALAERPDHYPMVFNLAQALEKSGDRDGALAQYHAGTQLAPLEPSFRLGVATLSEQAGDLDQARTAYRQYLELVPEGGESDKVRGRLERLERQSVTGAAAEHQGAVPN
jgi:tetratricopeptide (TPR) repeat protein